MEKGSLIKCIFDERDRESRNVMNTGHSPNLCEVSFAGHSPSLREVSLINVCHG